MKKGEESNKVNIIALELALKIEEREKCAEELLIAKSNNERCVEELMTINRELAGNKEKQDRELIIANNEIKEKEENLNEYINGLEKMIFMTSHRVRQPIANILGISHAIGQLTNSEGDVKRLAGYLKHSALSLDTFTKDLTTFMGNLEGKGKNLNGETGYKS